MDELHAALNKIFEGKKGSSDRAVTSHVSHSDRLSGGASAHNQTSYRIAPLAALTTPSLYRAAADGATATGHASVDRNG